MAHQGSSGTDLSRFLYNEVTRSISSPPLDEMLVHRRVSPNIKFAFTKNTTQCPRPWNEPGTTAPPGDILAWLTINDNFMQCHIAESCRYSVKFQNMTNNQKEVNYILPPEHDQNNQDDDHHSYTNTNCSPLSNIAA